MKRLFSYLMGISLLAVLFVSCSKDDTNNGIHGDNGLKAEILSAEVNGNCVISSSLDAANAQINYSTPEYARVEDLENMTLKLTLSDGANWAVKGGGNLDLGKPEVVIVVTSSDAKLTKEYTIKRAIVDVENVVSKVANTYSGNLVVSLNGNPLDGIPQNVYITAVSFNRVNLKIKDFAFSETPIGDIVVNDIVLYPHADSVSIVGKGDVKFDLDGTELNTQVAIDGRYNNAEQNIVLKIGVDGVVGLVIKVDFTGVVLADPIATTPTFVSVSGDCVRAQTFKDGNLTFYVNNDTPAAELSKITNTILVPKGAKLEYHDNKAFDFGTSIVGYFYVTSADASVVRKQYSISLEKIVNVNTTTYDFSDWRQVSTYYETELVWATPNQAVALLQTFNFYPKEAEFTVAPIDAGKVGKAAKLLTLDTKGGTMLGMAFPKVTAGTIFTGSFVAFDAMNNALLSTKFGLPYNGAKVTSVKGWYTYAPGSAYYDGTTLIVDVVDQPSVSAVIYEVTDDPKAVLTGLDIFDSPRIIASGAILPVASSTFAEFKVDLTYYKPYTPATKLYKLAIIMSASKDGAAYKGAPGSTFIVDELNLVTE